MEKEIRKLECAIEHCNKVLDNCEEESCYMAHLDLRNWLEELLHIKSNGFYSIVIERIRQTEIERFSVYSDKEYKDEELALGAAAYALPESKREYYYNYPKLWPSNWYPHMWKPTPNNRLRELCKAGALIIAEMERLMYEKNLSIEEFYKQSSGNQVVNMKEVDE